MSRQTLITLMLGGLLAIGTGAFMGMRRRQNKWLRYVYPMMKRFRGNRLMKRMMKNLSLAR